MEWAAGRDRRSRSGLAGRSGRLSPPAPAAVRGRRHGRRIARANAPPARLRRPAPRAMVRTRRLIRRRAMIYGLYLSAAGVLPSSYRQDVIANNLANSETVGFKKDLPLFGQPPTEA